MVSPRFSQAPSFIVRGREHRILLVRNRCITDGYYSKLKATGSDWGESPCRDQKILEKIESSRNH